MCCIFKGNYSDQTLKPFRQQCSSFIYSPLPLFSIFFLITKVESVLEKDFTGKNEQFRIGSTFSGNSLINM